MPICTVTASSAAPSQSDVKRNVNDDSVHLNIESAPLLNRLNFVSNSTSSLNTTDDLQDKELKGNLEEGKRLHQAAQSLGHSCNSNLAVPDFKGGWLKKYGICTLLVGGVTGCAFGIGMLAGYKPGRAANGNNGTPANRPSPDSTPHPVIKVNQTERDSIPDDRPLRLSIPLPSYDDTEHAHFRRHLSDENVTGGPAGPQQMKSRKRFHKAQMALPTATKRANRKVTKLLRTQGLLDPGKVSKESLVSAVSGYLYGSEAGIAGNTDRLRELARKMLAANRLYGGQSNEELSLARAEAVVYQWLFSNVLGKRPTEYITDRLKADPHPEYYTVSSIRHLLDIQTLLKNRLIHYRRIPEEQWGNLSAMWYSALTADMPFLKFAEDSVPYNNEASAGALELGSCQFANLFTGSLFLKNLSDEDFSAEDAMAVGESMWELAVLDGVTEDNIAYYDAPARFFTANQSSENGKQDVENVIESINSYVQFRETQATLQQDIKQKFNNYLSATKKWRSKGLLADKIIAECPDLFPLLATKGDSILNRELQREEEEKKAKERYLLGTDKPCKTAPDSLKDEYSKLTSDVADSFQNIDRYLVLSALSSLHEDDRSFISSADTTLHEVLFDMKTDRNRGGRIPQNVNIRISLDNTDLFAARRGGHERIYALKKINKPDGSYGIHRVDHDIQRYTSQDLLDRKDLKLRSTLDDEIMNLTPDSREKITCKIAVARQITTGDNIMQLADNISIVHRNTLYNSLHASGNDQAEIEKLWNTAKHFIPFYDCIDGSIKHDAALAVPSCLLDIISFLPLAGKAVSLSNRFGMSIARQGFRAGSAVAVGKGVLRGASLPTTAELASLGKDALRAADPGFALAGRISRQFGNKIIKYLSVDKVTAVLVRRIESSLGTRNFLQPSLVSPVMVTLPRTRLQVPAIKLGIKDGREIYIRTNTETGEKFGKYFFRDMKGGMLEIKTNHGIYGGVNVGKVIPTYLRKGLEEFRRYIKEFKVGQCTIPAVRSKRQVNCRPLSLSVQTLNRVLEYATVDELSVLAQNQKFRDSVFRTVNEAARSHPESADRLIESIGIAAEKSGNTDLLSTIAIGRVDTDIQRALARYQTKFVKKTEMVIKSPRVLGSYDFHGYNPNPNIPSMGVHASYTAIDTDNFVRRLNIVMHGEPGNVFLNGNTRLNADELYQSLYEHGIFDQVFTEIRMLVCSSADDLPNGGVSVAERLSQLTGKPVEGFRGTVTMYETFNIGDISIPSANMVNDAYLQGGTFGATEFMHNNCDYISIGVHPFPDVPNNPETFYPF